MRIGSEVTEEEIQLLLEPVLRSLILKEDFSAPTFEDAAYTAILTALTTGTLNVGGNVGSNSSLTNQNANSTNTYRADLPQNVDLPTVPIINLSMQSVADLNGGTLPQTGNALRKNAIDRARVRLGLDENSAAYIPASNVLRNGEEYVLKITPSSLKKMLSPADGNAVQVESIVILDNIERIANNGVWFDSQGDRKNRTQINGIDHLKTTVYIDNAPYEVDMRVRLVQENPQAQTENVLYYYTPEEVVTIEKAGTNPPTDERRALIGASEGVPASSLSVPHSTQSVNEQKLHTKLTEKDRLLQEGKELLNQGHMVSDELLAAMGVTQRQAKSIVADALAHKGDFSGYVDLMHDLSGDKQRRDLQKAYEEMWKRAQEESGSELEKTERLQYNEKSDSQKEETRKTGIKDIGLQFFANSKDCKTIVLPKQEYAHVMSELATNLTEAQMEQRVVSKAIGKHVYTFENNGFGEYRIIGKRLIDQVAAEWWGE